MKQFKYTIKDELGLHARPAGLLAKLVKDYSSKVTITKDGKSADASKLIAIMGMGVKKNEEVTVSVEGADESTAVSAIKDFFSKNL